MKKTSLLLLPILAATTFVTMSGAINHSATSSLSQGKWVKIRIDSTGLYKLSREKLLSLGFENPEKVSVFGHGLTPRSSHFINLAGEQNVDADLAPVPITMVGDDVYFLGVGPNWMTYLESDNNLPGYYARKYKPIYSRCGYYLITDSQPVLRMDTVSTPDSASYIDSPVGTSYVLHDRNLTHGFFESGQIYLGEPFETPGNKLSWNVSLPNVILSTPIVVTGAAYSDDSAGPSTNYAGNNFNFKVGDELLTTVLPKADVGVWNNLITSNILTTAKSDKIDISAWISGSWTFDHAALDYWLLSYICQLPEAISRGMTVTANLEENQSAHIDVNRNLSKSLTLDVSTPQAPRIIEVVDTDENNYLRLYRAQNAPMPRPLIFDLDGAYEPTASFDVANTNIHEQAAKGADLLIITIPSLRGEAERLAEVHRRYDGMDCIVATVEEIYNEYNSGQPDIMAYKSLVRQIYEVNGDRHLDVLLFGPLKGDMLAIRSDEEVDANNCIIAYQSDIFPQKGDSHNINEFIGMMDDVLNVRHEYADIKVGVGILPCLSVEEAARMVNKVERYITEPNYELYVNKMVGMGGAGDNQVHIKQTVEFKGLLDKYYANGIIYTLHPSEAYVKVGQRERFIDYINSGQSLITYMGHGSPESFDRVPIMTKGNQWALKNKILPFMCFGMCDATGPDRHSRGLSETMIMSNNDGLIGAIMSTRTAYSNQNASLIRLFLQHLSPTLYKDSIPAEQEMMKPKTVGQVYAEARTALRTLHENTFTLMADPALKLVTPVGHIKMTEDVSPIIPIGTMSKLRGVIQTNTGNPMSNFNGKCVARVMMPSTTQLCPTLVSNQDLKDTQKAQLTFDGMVEATFYGIVNNGEWEIDFNPAETGILNDNQTLWIKLSAYDSTQRIAATGSLTASFQKMTGDQKQSDVLAPTIDIMEYEESDGRLNFRVSDNHSFMLATDRFEKGLEVKLDGREIAHAELFCSIEPKTVSGPSIMIGNIPIQQLSTGVHTAELRVTDNAGNVAERMIHFNVGQCEPDRTLVIDKELTNDVITFVVDKVSKARLMISDHTGNIVDYKSIDGSEIVYDLTNRDGIRLPQGVYRAWIISDSPDYGHSNSVIFGVLAPHVRQ